MPPPFAVTSGEFDSDAHAICRQYRPLTPLLVKEDGAHIAIRAADVGSLMVDPRTRQMETEIAWARGINDGPLSVFLENTMVLSNGTSHRRRRLPLARAFGFKFMAALRPRVRAIADELIDTMYEAGESDFMTDFANVLPARVICHILGVPRADIPEFTRSVYSLSRAFSATFAREDVPEMQNAAHHLSHYVQDLLMDRRIHPQEDFLTAYKMAADEPEGLSPTEAIVQVMTILIGGIDTTRGALAIQTSLLLEHPGQWRDVCGDPGLVPQAVLECMRFEPPVASVPRVTLEDIMLDGVLLPRDRVLALSTLSAMRDPAVYMDPDRLVIHRSDLPTRHPVFGGGVHRCLGETLAMVELEEGMAALAARLPGLELDGDPVAVKGGFGIRKVAGLRVRWGRARG